MVKLGIITIGQSPRKDLTEDLQELLSKKITIIEIGLLDKYTYKQVLDKFNPSPGENILVSRMADGKEVELSEPSILKTMQESILELEKQVDMTLILCTGKFPKYKHTKPLLIPQELLHGLVSKLSPKKDIGVIVPKHEQINQITNWWKKSGVQIQVKAASPYQNNESIKVASNYFKTKDIDYIVLDCMGYSQKMKKMVKRYSQKMVILPRTLIARIINELII